jgi:hypothetical protein
MEAIHSFLATFDVFGMIFQYILSSFTHFGELFGRSFTFIATPIEKMINSNPPFYYSILMAGALFGLYYIVSSLIESRARARRIRK